MGRSVDVVVLVTGVVELHDLGLALGLVVDHLLHGAAVLQHGLCAHPLLGADDAVVHVHEVVLNQPCGTLGGSAVGIDSLAEAALGQVIDGQFAAHTDGSGLELVDLVAHALHRDCTDTRANECGHLAVAVHVLGQNLVGVEDIAVVGAEVAVTEEGLSGNSTPFHGHQGIGIEEIQFSRHCCILLTVQVQQP